MGFKPDFNANIGGYFSYNVDQIRDINETLGAENLVSTDGDSSFGLNSNGHIVMKIRSVNYHTRNNYVCIEYRGDGVCYIEPTDSGGNVIDDTRRSNKLFDTHWVPSTMDTHEVFKEKLKKEFNVSIR